MSDAADRARARGVAVEDRRGVVLVEASAGTGKTTVLVDRVLHTVESGERRLGEIAVVTFTELAAAELKFRLRGALDARLRELVDIGQAASPAAARLRQALVDLESAAVGTIHAFAAELLRKRPAESGVDPGFAVADELGMRLLFAEAWEEFLRALSAGGDPGLEVAADLGLASEPDLRAAAWSVFSFLRSGQPLAPPGPPLLVLDKQRQVVALLEEAAVKAQRGGSLAGELADKLPLYRELLRLSERDASRRWLTSPPPTLPKNRGRKEFEAEAKDLYGKARQLCDELRRDLGDDRLRRLAAWLAPLRQRYERLAHEQGRLDFDDLLHRALRLVREHPAVEQDFRRQYPVLLVDEFQDTDPIQTDLLLALAGPPSTDPADVRCLFVVGDPKQSIYRFRGADVENYRQVQERPGTRTVRLRRTFRPVAELVAWTNEVMGKVMTDTGLERDPDAIEYQPLEIDEPAEGRLVPPAPRGVVYLELETPSSGRVAPVRAAEARAMARWARDYVEGGGEPRTVRGAGDAPRPVRYGDVALLLPRLSQFEVWEKELVREGVPFRVEAGRHYYRRDEVQALVQALTLLADPGDSVATLAVLRGPAFGLTDEDLLAYALLDPAPRFDLRSGASPERLRSSPRPEAAARVAAALDRLRALRDEVATLPLAELVAAVVEGLGLVPYFALQNHGEQRVGNLRKAAEVARRMAAQGVGSLPAFVRAIEALFDQEIPEADAFVHETTGDALRVLTIHAAKGLEFPVVLLGDLAGQSGGGGDRLRIARGEMKMKVRTSTKPGGGLEVTTSGFERVKEEEDRRERNEDKRKLYVAVTRARDLLVLPHLDAARVKVSLSPLFQHLYGAGDGRPRDLGAAAAAVSILDAATLPVRERAPAAPFDPDRLAELAIDDVTVAERLAVLAATRARIGGGSRLLRPSALEGDAPAVGAAPRRASEEALAARRRALRVGDAAHALVAAGLAEQGASPPAALAVLPPDLRPAAGSLADAFLSSPLAARARRARGQRRIEEPLALATAKGLLDARLDLAFVEEGEWVVVDLKSDRLEAREVPARARHYAPQTALYAAGLERITGRPVREIHLFFMAPALDHAIAGQDLERLRRTADELLGGAG